jgi:hypothetical protein
MNRKPFSDSKTPDVQATPKRSNSNPPSSGYLMSPSPFSPEEESTTRSFSPVCSDDVLTDGFYNTPAQFVPVGKNMEPGSSFVDISLSLATPSAPASTSATPHTPVANRNLVSDFDQTAHDDLVAAFAGALIDDNVSPSASPQATASTSGNASTSVAPTETHNSFGFGSSK